MTNVPCENQALRPTRITSSVPCWRPAIPQAQWNDCSPCGAKELTLFRKLHHLGQLVSDAARVAAAAANAADCHSLCQLLRFFIAFGVKILGGFWADWGVDKISLAASKSPPRLDCQ